MRFIWIAILVASSLFGGELNWSNDYEASLKMAKIQNKDIYVLATSSSCVWCRKLENTTLRDKDVLKKLNEKYILVHLDKDVDKLPEWFNCKRVPKHYFITNMGKEIYSFLGYWGRLDFKSYLGDIDKKKIEKGL